MANGTVFKMDRFNVAKALAPAKIVVPFLTGSVPDMISLLPFRICTLLSKESSARVA